MINEFDYGLLKNQDLRRIAPPFPDVRNEFCRLRNAGPSKPPMVLIFDWVDGKPDVSACVGAGGRVQALMLESLIGRLTPINRQWIDGDKRLLRTELPGDWVYRPQAGRERLIEELAAILRDEMHLPIRLELREVERSVYVASGNYRHVAFEGRKPTVQVDNGTADAINIFATEITDDGPGSCSGSFDLFLDCLSGVINVPILSEARVPANTKFSWTYHHHFNGTAEQMAADEDPLLVLPNIAEQTGLQFEQQVRKLPILFVEEITSAAHDGK